MLGSAPGIEYLRSSGPDTVVDPLGGGDLHQVLQEDHVVHHHLVIPLLLPLSLLRLQLETVGKVADGHVHISLK